MNTTGRGTGLTDGLPSCLGAVVWSLTLAVISSGNAPAAGFRSEALAVKRELIERIMPYWHDTAIDRTNGGFILADDGTGVAGSATEKQLVTQARMIWGFSHAHLHGLSDGRRNYLGAARQGREFLKEHFYDRQHGGYFWTTDLQGKPISRNKIVYGQSFVIYALVEYFRASRDRSALEEAMELYRDLQKHAHDQRNRGWIEHFTADWTPLLKPTPEAVVEVAGYKSANTHLHLMEAFAELYEATGDRQVRKSVQEVLDINRRHFYPRNPAQSCFHRELDWGPVTKASSAGLSYGHNVEFAWLMVRAQEVLKQKPAWAHFYAHIDHALKYGYDQERGGLFSLGTDDQPANNRDKIWWVEAEMLAALVDSLKHKDNAAHAAALASLLDFIRKYQADPKDGIWFDTVSADGIPKKRGKAHNWKANYHDVRAMVKFVEGWGGAAGK